MKGNAWTGELNWPNVLDITKIDGDGKYWDKRRAEAQKRIAEFGEGVIYFPAGVYHFENHIDLKNFVVLRGATPKGKAHDKDCQQSPAGKW